MADATPSNSHNPENGRSDETKRASSRDKDRDRDRDRDKDRDKDKDRKHKSRKHKSRSRSRSKGRHSRDKRKHSRSRSRSRSRSHHRSKKSRSKSPEKKPVNENERAARTMLVSQLHPKIDEKDLFNFFSNVGTVEDIRLIRDSRTKKSKGLCYVEFTSTTSVNPALALNGQLIAGYPIAVTLAQNMTPAKEPPKEAGLRLFIGSLNPAVGEEDLKPMFESFGPLEFIEITRDASGKSRGFGAVQYTSAAHAKAAMDALNGIPLADRPMKVALHQENYAQQVAAAHAAHAAQFVQLAAAKVEIDKLKDDEGDGGLAMSATDKFALMAKLQRAGESFVPQPSVSAVNAPKPPPMPAPIASAQLNVPLIQATTCLVIKNMFDPKEEEEGFDIEIKEDVEEEAGKFGPLRHIFVDKNSIGFVYLRFDDVSSSRKARDAFHGRWFASRQISAEFVSEATYELKFPKSKP